MSAKTEEIIIAKYVDNIVQIRNKTTGEDVSHLTRAITKMVHPASNTKVPIYRFVLNDKCVTRNNSFVVKYKCWTCAIEQEISLTLYIRKVNKHMDKCAVCCNLDETKRQNHSKKMQEYSKARLAGAGKKIEKPPVMKWNSLSLHERVDASITEWNEYDDEFRLRYSNIHLDEKEFENLRSKIVSIGNRKITDITQFVYIPAFKVFNQTRFTPMLVDFEHNLIEKPYYIEYICEGCECTFINRDLEVRKNKYKTLCRECSFCNKIFKRRSYKMPNGNTIIYQSGPELQFIKWCNENSVKIENGPQIKYEFDGKPRKYSVDFCLPDIKMLIEIKDNHIWHIRQVETGKWPAKERCAIAWGEEHGYTYTIMYPKTSTTVKSEILVRCKTILL